MLCILTSSALFVVCLLPSGPRPAQLPPLPEYEGLPHNVLAPDVRVAGLPTQLPALSHRMRAAAPADRWWALDKAQHLTFSFLWTLSTQYVLTDKVGWSDRAALPAAVGSGAAVGLSKELFDWRVGPTGRFSTRDLAADAVGILLAAGIIVL
jgi:hypothetical protein